MSRHRGHPVPIRRRRRSPSPEFRPAVLGWCAVLARRGSRAPVYRASPATCDAPGFTVVAALVFAVFVPSVMSVAVTV